MYAFENTQYSNRPTRKAYNILLDAFAISGMIEEAKTVFKSMRRDRLDLGFPPPPPITNNILQIG